MPATTLQPVSLIGVPMDLGAGRRGVDMGPSAIRYARLVERIEGLGRRVEDTGDLPVPVPESREAGDPRARYLGPITAACRDLAARVRQVTAAGRFPVILGGDHSIAVGSVAGFLAGLRARPGPSGGVGGGGASGPAAAGGPAGEAGLVWLDAHGDCNTPETSPTGNIHGMPVACLLGQGPAELVDCHTPGAKLRPENVVLIGVRALDPPERKLLQRSGVTVYTMHAIDRLGMAAVMERAIKRLERLAGRVHVSLDLDVLDPQVAGGVGTPSLGGLTYREGHLALEMLHEAGLPGSLEVVELNPVLDRTNQTGQVAVELIASALGASIL